MSAQLNKEECSLKFSPSNKSIKQISDPMMNGAIVKLLPTKKIGFIKAEIPDRFCKKDVYFTFDCIVNTSSTEIELCESMDVQFTLKKGERFISKPSASIVMLMRNVIDQSSSECSEESRINGIWETGFIVHISNIIIMRDRSCEKKVLMHPDKISLYTLPLKKNDRISYIPNDSKAETLKVRKAKVDSYAQRSQNELLSYLYDLHSYLQSENEMRVIQEISNAKKQWDVYTEWNPNEETEELFLGIMSLLEKFLVYEDWKINLLMPTITSLLESRMVKNCNRFLRVHNLDCLLPSENEVFEHTDWTRKQFFHWLCIQVMTAVPELSYALLPIIVCFCNSSCSGCSIVFNLLAKSLSVHAASNQCKLDLHWKKTPLSLIKSELLSDDLITLRNINRVIASDPYSSEEEYIETYFTLFRIESYHGVYDGIKNLLKGTLDNRDMEVYHSIHITGFNIELSGIYLLIKFSTVKPVTDWLKSMKLMTGNLLCISPTQTFEDVIWATVAARDPDCLKKSSSILLQLSDLNDTRLSDILKALIQSNGQTVMAESPTFFPSVGPILRALKKIKIEKLKLNKQLVKGQYISGVDYLSSFVNQSNQCCSTEDDTYSEFSLQMKKLEKQFDKDQWDALNYALESPLAVIQGPPGCGKTFVGVKLAELIFTCNLDNPILVLTYKNHALDEFLMHATEFCSTGDIVRLGGRSKNDVMKKCMLQKHMESDCSMSRQFQDQFYEIKDEIKAVKEKAENAILTFYEDTCLTATSLIKALNESQINSLLIDAKYGGNQSIKCKINGKNVTKKKLLDELLPAVKASHHSLVQYVCECSSETDDSKLTGGRQLWRILLEAAAVWFPPATVIEKLKQLLKKSIVLPSSDDKSSEKKDKEDTADEDYVKSFEEQRATSLGRQSHISKSIIFSEKVFSSTSLSDLPSTMGVNTAVLQTSKMWSLDDAQRIQFIYSLLMSKSNSTSSLVDDCNNELNQLIEKKNLLEMEKKLSVIKKKKIIGATITGAATNHDLIQLVKPSIVIVEEAAEIMEPCLLATLNEDVEHLILIGDHMQLRPKVETYVLAKDYGLDISLMERLISLNYPYKILSCQSRMRKEFSNLLLDIYPNLTDNVEKIENNKPPSCMGSCMFFWDHSLKEDGLKDKSSRSKVNSKEAEMVVSLVVFLLFNGTDASKISIISAYLGQTAIIRTMLKTKSKLFPYLSVSCIDVQTIDNFQGDENDVIIVSLVRSNDKRNAGFVNTLNRRCVAQSRARCAMYIIGNIDTICNSETSISVWKHLVEKMDSSGCVGTKIGVKCPNENHKKISLAGTSASLLNIVNNSSLLCSEVCGYKFECMKPEHACKKKCKPPHDHGRCHSNVGFVHKLCLHTDEKHCFEDPSTLKCKKIVAHEYKFCKHTTTKMCFIPENEIGHCKQTCRGLMEICGHTCMSICGLYHDHRHCEKQVTFRRSSCQHEGVKLCFQDQDSIDCMVMVDKILNRCGHTVKAECFKLEKNVKCTYTCNKMMKCQKHECKSKCSETHTHELCQEKVDFWYEKCGHQGKKKRKCSDTEVDTECTVLITSKAKCGHPIQHKCFQSIKDIICQHPCERKLSCGHLCRNLCGESCTINECKLCMSEFEKKLAAFRKNAEIKAQKIAASMANVDGISGPTKLEIKNSGTSMAEYVKVEDQVMKSIKSEHGWNPKITKIEKVINYSLEYKFEKMKTKTYGTFVAEKFHGTSNDGVDGIINQGFRLPGPPSYGKQPGMYGQGIYFATDSSKSAQDIYTKGSNKLLLCNVLLGNSKVLHGANHQITKNVLDKEKCDSIHAPRGSAVKNDEFVVFNPDQALPLYIIHFSKTGLPSPPTAQLQTVKGKDFVRRKLTRSRKFDLHDEDGNLYRLAESIYFRQSANRNTQHYGNNSTPPSIESIDCVFNRKLLTNFEAKKKEFNAKKIPDHEILAFHGTKSDNVDSILTTNLDPHRPAAHGRAHGDGVYFSEFPDFSLMYGKSLILFRVLPGRENNGSSRSASLFYNSTVVGVHGDGCGEQLVIQDADQYVPYFVYNLK